MTLMSKDKGVKPSISQSVEIKLDILNSEEFQNELKNLREVFAASYGPNGRTKVIQHVSGGHVTVTSCSSQLLRNITTVSNPLTRLLLQSVQGHVNHFNDGGLFTALLTIQLIEFSLKCGLPRHKVIAINELALLTILRHVESSAPSIKLPADLGNMRQMLSVTRSILKTKPATGLTDNDIDPLAILLLRGFLHCVPKYGNKAVSLNNLRIQECKGPSIRESCLKKGILLESECHELTETTYENQGNVKVALFDCSLAGNVDDEWWDTVKTEISSSSITIENNILTLMKRMVDGLIDHGVKLIACQKVIHPTLQRYITRKGLYVIERLSISHIGSVLKLTGARLLSSFQGKMSEDSFGSLSEINTLVLHKKRYIHLIPQASTYPEVSTLILCTPDELALDELKLLCSSVLQSLKQLVYQPFLVPGGGCFETIIAGLFLKTAQEYDGISQLGCSKHEYSTGFHSLASALLQIAKTLNPGYNHHLVDRMTFHHWISQPQATSSSTPQHCLCGLVTGHQETEWYMTEELCGFHRDNHIDVHTSSTTNVKEVQDLVLDVMTMKVNGIKIAFETANTILRVKHFVKEMSD